MEAFMLMATEKEILMRLDSDDVIDRVAEKSKLLRNLLLLLHKGKTFIFHVLVKLYYYVLWQCNVYVSVGCR